MKGVIKDFLVAADRSQQVTITLYGDFREKYEELKGAPVEVDVKRYRVPRSKSANDYLWVLCTEIAKKTGAEKDEVYRENVRQGTVFRRLRLQNDAVGFFKKVWTDRGVAWFCEDEDVEEEYTVLRAYYGSSSYNVAEMQRLLDRVIQDAKALGIDTRTPDEIANMLSLWQSE